jgi:monoterpene epsilon-lactone hydrolase
MVTTPLPRPPQGIPLVGAPLTGSPLRVRPGLGRSREFYGGDLACHIACFALSAKSAGRAARRGPMTKQQQVDLDAILRQGGLDLEADVDALRSGFEQVMAQVPVPEDVEQRPVTIGGVDGIEVVVGGVDDGKVIVYLHGGVYVIGSAATSVPLVADLARRTGARAISLDYRLAPEHPFPAALDDVVDAYRGLLELDIQPADVVFAGESAGGGLAVATLMVLRDTGAPLPSSALLMSPYADLTLSGESIAARAAVDPTLTPSGLRRRVEDYAGDVDPSDPQMSPIFGDLRGLPPLLIQVGSNEILLSDAVRLAGRAAADDVAVTLEVVPGVPHVFQGFAALLDEGNEALDRAATFLRRPSSEN